MIMHGTQVTDQATGNTLFNRGVSIYQPRSDEGLWRAHLSEQQFGDRGRPMWCRRGDNGLWLAVSDAPCVRDESLHPDLPDYVCEYVLVARQTLGRLGSSHFLTAFFGSDQDAEFRYEDNASIAIQSKVADGRSPDDNFLNHVPGIRILENGAISLIHELGVQHDGDEGGKMIGDLCFKVAEDSLVVSYDIDEDVSYLLTSEVVDGQWKHATKLLLTTYQPDNIIDKLKKAGLEDQQAFEENLEAFVFSYAFPRLASGSIMIAGAEQDEEGYTFHIRPGDLRGTPENLPN